jgi:hypothetical protein
MAISHLYPSQRPSLDLNFARTKRLDPRITFTRASSGTYVDENGVIQSAASGVARFDHDPVTGESLGLLVEEARANLLKYSKDFNQSSDWAFTQAIPTFNSSVAPDGTITATRLTSVNTLSTQYITSTGSNTVSAGARVASVYVKPGTCTQVQLQFNADINTRICFNLANNTTFNIQANGSNGAGTIADVGNGWKRLTLASTTAITDTVAIYLLENQGFTVSAGLTLEIWGFQVEAGTFPTSYIPTPATFTSRAFTATYYDASGVIQTAAIDVARDNTYFPDENGVMRPAGLLLEESRTNLLLRSEEFDAAAWTTNAVNASASPATGIVAPDGTNTTYTVTSTAANGIIRQDATSASATTYTWSCFVKKKTSPAIEIAVLRVGGTAYSANLTYNFDTDTVSLVSDDYGNSPYGRQLLPNGWVRIYATVTDQGSNTQARMYLRPSSTGASDMYVWGAQLEAGSFPTSYIPTTSSAVTRAADISSSSTVTRAADVATIEGSNFSSWYNQSEGTTLSIAKTFTPTGTDAHIYGYSGTGAVERMEHNAKASFQFLIYDNTFEYNQSLANYIQNQTNTAAFAYKLDSANSSLNGTLGSEDTSVNPVAPNKIFIGARFNGNNPLNGTISRLTYYPTRLSDTILQNLTL